MTGYVILVLLFAGLVAACFVPGLMEYWRPKDAGPLKIDMNRNISERYFSQSFRRLVDQAVTESSARPRRSKPIKTVFHGMPGRRITANINRGNEDMIEINGNLVLPADTTVGEVLIVRGSLTTGPNCDFKKELLVDGSAKMGPRNNLLCLSADYIDLGEDGEVAGWLDADRAIHLRRGCHIRSRATAGDKVVIEDKVTSPRFAAPEIDLGTKILAADGGGSPKKADQTIIEWTPELDQYLRMRFDTDSLEEIRRAVVVKFQISIPEIILLRRAGLLSLIQESLFRLDRNRKPAYMRSSAVWLQGGETARVKGSIEIPDGEVVPFNLIVTGNLKSGEHVIFQGGVHVSGKTTIGKANVLWKSLVSENNISLGDYTVVENCVDSDTDIAVGRSVKVGRGLDGGGMSAGGTITLSDEFEGHNKVFANEGVASGERTK